MNLAMPLLLGVVAGLIITVFDPPVLVNVLLLVGGAILAILITEYLR